MLKPMPRRRGRRPRRPGIYRSVPCSPRCALLPSRSSLRVRRRRAWQSTSPPGRLGVCTMQTRTWPPGVVDSHASVRTRGMDCRTLPARQHAQNDVVIFSKVERGNVVLFSAGQFPFVQSHSKERSLHCGFTLSISLFFFFLFQLLICFSLSIAAILLGVSSK